MAGSSIGKLLCLTTFGESHGTAIGGVLDGYPSDVEINLVSLQNELNKRRPGQSSIVSQRDEKDHVEFLSGVFEGRTTGTPIAFIIRNNDAKSKDYDHLASVFRPSHADFTYHKKYGHRDYNGGGRSSARETISRVVAGALAKQFLEKKGIFISAFVDQIGDVKMSELEYQQVNVHLIEDSIVRCPIKMKSDQMEELIRSVRKEGDTIGGSIYCNVTGVPAGLGEPVFDKLHADIGKGMLSINAVKGFEIGAGFSAITMKGSQHNDLFATDGSTLTNHSGGIQGGISNGMPIHFRVAFKPVATLLISQDSISDKGEHVLLKGKGRHDACVVPRAVVIVEAMTALILMDFYLLRQAYK